MRPHLQWLGQGDIFREAPVLDVTYRDYDLIAEFDSGPAVLLTHDCAMDKPALNGGIRAKRLQFARLRSMQALSEAEIMKLRNSKSSLGPFDALYVGSVGDFGECFLYLSDPYFVPVEFFDVRLETYPDPNDAGAIQQCATAFENDTRIGRLDEDQLLLLRRKMLAFWTRLQEEG